MHITLAIPTFNRADSLAETLHSVAQLEIPSNTSIEVLVVDNNSIDHTFEVAHRAALLSPVPLRYVMEKEPGLCFGRNRALREARGEHVVFLDDDIHISSLWLFGYLNALHTFAADCVVGPVTPRFPQRLPAYANRYVLSLIGSDYSRKGDVAFVVPAHLAHEIPGCNFGVRRAVAIAIGGFDNSLDRSGTSMLSGGDTEFGVRLRSDRRTVVYEPRCAIDHIIPPRKLEQAYLRRLADGAGVTRAMVRAKHGPKRDALSCLSDAKRAAGLWARWQARRARGQKVAAFEWELRTRWHVTELLALVRGMSVNPRKL